MKGNCSFFNHRAAKIRSFTAMQKNRLVIAFMGIIVLFLALYFRNNSSQSPDSKYFNRNIHDLSYSRHARCRMDCRGVTETEVVDILKNGIINLRKTRFDDQPCPSFALEGYSQQDSQHLRIVFAQCETLTRVVTCIDLDNDYTCLCK